MNLDKLISIAVKLVLLAVMTGQLPRVLKEVKIAQLKLLKESQASKWPNGMLLNGETGHEF